MLADGKGGFQPKYPGRQARRGRHLQAGDGARRRRRGQVRLPRRHRRARRRPPTRARFSFYRKDPGYNSLGMYYSVYYNRGEATHGYHSVPPYPASHGCIRNPIPDSVFIYNWIDLGDRCTSTAEVADAGGDRGRPRDDDACLAELREHALVIGEVDALERADGAVLRRRAAGAAAARPASAPPAS